MISVVIPVLNGRALLPVTAPAVLAMEGVGEIVWVDDGSTDGTGAWLEDVLAEHPQRRVLRLAANVGRAAARNAGVAETTGDMIVFLDADVEPTVATASALARAAAQPGALAAVARLGHVVTDPSEPYQDYAANHARGPVASIDPGAVLDWRYFLSGICAMTRSTFVQLGGFDTAICYGEDVELACRLAEVEPAGLRLADATARLHDIGTLADALDRAHAFGTSLRAFGPACRRKVLGRLAAVRGIGTVARVAASPLNAFISNLPPGGARRVAVRYLLATRILSAFRA